MKQWSHRFVILAALLTCVSCGAITRAQYLVKQSIQMRAVIVERANQNNPFAVNLVLVFDEDLLKELLKLPSRQWFEKRGQFKRDFPEGKAFEILEWEWTPGQQVAEQFIPVRARTQGAIMFVNYAAEGEHRARINPLESFQADFMEDTFLINGHRG